MPIKWLNVASKEGTASLYATNITLNTVASVPLEYAYRVQVGFDDNDNVVIQPLNKEKVIRGDLDEYSLLKISQKKTYSRISSTRIMEQIAEHLGIVLDNEPKKFKTIWDDNENVLVILTGKEK